MRSYSKGLIYLIFAMLTLIVVGCSSDDSSSSDGDTEDEKIVLRASTGLPADQVWQEPYFHPWMEMVEERSEGRVEFEFYGGAELVELGGELDALKAGTIDVAMPIMHLYDPKRFPLSEITMMPLINSSSEIANDAYRGLLKSDVELEDGKTFYELEMEANGIKSWPVTAGYPYVINSTDTEFDSPEDFDNLRIRIAARINEVFVNNLGANPISMNQNETYDALSRGALDGTVMPIGDWTTWGLDDLLQNAIIGADIGHFTAIMSMTEEKWNSLPDDIQDIMEEVAEELSASTDVVQFIDEREVEVVEELDGIADFKELDDLNDETREHIIDAMGQTWLDWIDIIEEQGSPGKEVAKLWRDLIIEAGGDVPDVVKELD